MSSSAPATSARRDPLPKTPVGKAQGTSRAVPGWTRAQGRRQLTACAHACANESRGPLNSPRAPGVMRPLCYARGRCSQGPSKGGGDAKQRRKKTIRDQAGIKSGITALPHRRASRLSAAPGASTRLLHLPGDDRRSQHHADAVLEHGEAARVHRALAESSRPSRRHGQGDDAGRGAPSQGTSPRRFASRIPATRGARCSA